MLDETAPGTRDPTGSWEPDPRCDFGPLFAWPTRPLAIATWFVTGDVLSWRTSLDTHGYAHYLHHEYFEVNHSDGAVPLDRWFGSFHDGSPEATERLRTRRPAALVES